MSVSNRQLLALIRDWVTDNYPACPLEYVVIHLRYLPVPIQLADSQGAASPRLEDEEASNETANERNGLAQVVLDVLDVLRQAKHRMTTTRILEALERGKKYHGRRTVERHLSLMVQDGTLNNQPRSVPPGYGFPEWDADGACED